MAQTETPYGTVTVRSETVTIEATKDQLQEWARDKDWGGSDLAILPGAFCQFAHKGLVDTDTDVPVHELNAWASDAARDVLPRDHPCWPVVVAPGNDDR